MDKIEGFCCFEDSLMLKIGQGISEGLAHLHSKGIAHRDLKAKNILVSNQHYCHIADEEEKMHEGIFGKANHLQACRFRGKQVSAITNGNCS